MKKILYICFLFSIALTNTILVPEEYETIQLGIDAAVDGDTVLVNQGIYYENIHLTKSIVLTSYAIFDDLENWSTFNNDIEKWEVSNQNINNTIIDGGTAIDDYGSCILIYSLTGDCISPEIAGFTLQNGIGTMVERNEEQQRIGGGILFDISDPTISYNQIINNGSGELFSGGGTYGTSMEEDWSFNNRDLNIRSRCDINEFNLANNLYNENDALIGNTFANVDFDQTINLSGSIFDVFDCDYSTAGLTSTWMNVESEANVNFEEGEGQLCFITNSNVYIDSNIQEECLESQSCGSLSNPFKTIKRALEMINPTSENFITINMSNGIYSPDSNEEFPIILPSYTNLIGENQNLTILDAQGTIAPMMLNRTFDNNISNFTIKGGNANNNNSLLFEKWAGAIYLRFSINTILSNLTITENIGSGVYIEGEAPILTNLTITNNDALGEPGGGIATRSSNLTLLNTSITNNSASYGGGIQFDMLLESTFKNVLIANNIATCEYNHSDDTDCGGGSGVDISSLEIDEEDYNDLYSTNQLVFENVTISDNIGENRGALNIKDFPDPIITNTIIWNNYPESIYTLNSNPIVSYSNITGGWNGLENINSNPLFIDSENGDYSLQNDSPCINSGNPNNWYNDLNNTTSDMGFTGGLFILPNFTSYNFEDVGNFGANKEFTLFNYRNDPIVIDEIMFNSPSFYTDTLFPMNIAPLSFGYINIQTDNSNLGFNNGDMIIYSQDIISNLSVSLSSTGVSGNVLSGNISGTYPPGEYRINGDLFIDRNDIVTLQPGTQFLFDGNYGFNVNGTLEAIGTFNDSIIFDNYSNENNKWVGFLLDSVDDETIFKYVRISGVQGIFEPSINGGGAIGMMESSPILNNVKIHNNIGLWGGGILMAYSSPDLNNVLISSNQSESWGGGLYIMASNPIFDNVIVSNNMSNQFGGGIVIGNCNELNLENTIILENTAEQGAGIYITNSIATLKNISINDNLAVEDEFCSANEDEEEEGDSCGVGGAIYVSESTTNIINGTLSNNSAETYAGGAYFKNAEGVLINDIIWGNNSDAIISNNSSIQVYYSNIEGGWENIDAVGENTGNINTDPLFNNSENRDYTLQEDSPCIDSGTADIDGDGVGDITVFFGNAPDMGAFEFIVSLLGDLTGDEILNVVDIVALVNMILSGGYDPVADLNQDIIVNVVDIVALMNIILGN